MTLRREVSALRVSRSFGSRRRPPVGQVTFRSRMPSSKRFLLCGGVEERMEGAGASIVSHAVETRGMDSADEEPELPFAVQDLIWRLEGKGEPITTLLYLR